MAIIYLLVAIDFRPYLTGIREYVHLSIWHPYFNSGGSRFFQYQVTAASEDDRIKRGETSVDNAAFRFPLSAARVQGQLAGLNRQEVVDNPHCLIAIRRVQPPAADRQRRDGVKRVLPPTTGAALIFANAFTGSRSPSHVCTDLGRRPTTSPKGLRQ